jgi:hypothetical protein
LPSDLFAFEPAHYYGSGSSLGTMGRLRHIEIVFALLEPWQERKVLGKEYEICVIRDWSSGTSHAPISSPFISGFLEGLLCVPVTVRD